MVKVKYSDETTVRVTDGFRWAISDGFVWIYNEGGFMIRSLKNENIVDIEYSV